MQQVLTSNRLSILYPHWYEQQLTTYSIYIVRRMTWNELDPFMQRNVTEIPRHNYVHFMNINKT